MSGFVDRLLNAKSSEILLLLTLTMPAISSAQWIRYTTYTETPTLGATTGIVAGPDGNMWFGGGCSGTLVVFCNDHIGRITTAGVITNFPLPTANAGCAGIAAGSDGALWFTENDANKIGRITTSGVVSEYPIPTVNSGPGPIVNGPDGALWFTEFGGNKIGRVTVSGSITEYTIPTASGWPLGIAVGSDGALWFAESNAHKIGRVTTSGSFTEYTRPGENLAYIASGPDGALWFTTNNGATLEIGRITTTGGVTEFALPPTAILASLYGIIAGPDGALWFTLPNGATNTGLIGRITTFGDITEFPTPNLGGITSGGYTGIAIGPDGDLWYTDGQDSIVKAPACGLGLRLTYVPDTLTVDFDLGIYIPGTGQGMWEIYLVTNQIKKLWSQTGPSVAPPKPITIPIDNFPSIGNVGVISILTNPAGLACSDLQFVNTNGNGPSVSELREVIRSSGILPVN